MKTYFIKSVHWAESGNRVQHAAYVEARSKTLAINTMIRRYGPIFRVDKLGRMKSGIQGMEGKFI